MSGPKRKHAIVTWTQVATATGYKLFWGTTSHSYPYSQDVGTNLSYKVDGLRPNTTYYFSAKAYNDAGMSPFSNEKFFAP